MIYIFSDNANIQPNQDLTLLKTDRDFSRYILRVCLEDLMFVKNSPSYLHLKFSRSTMELFIATAKILYQDCLKSLITLMDRFDLETAYLVTECFKEVLIVLKTLYARKLAEFLKYLSMKLFKFH